MFKYSIFGERFCTYCGGTMYFFTDEDGNPNGVCPCGNVDFCNNETVEDVKNRYKDVLQPSKRKFINLK